MHTVLMVELVQKQCGWATRAWIARQVGIKQSNFAAYMNGRGHVGSDREKKLRGWCKRLLEKEMQ